MRHQWRRWLCAALELTLTLALGTLPLDAQQIFVTPPTGNACVTSTALTGCTFSGTQIGTYTLGGTPTLAGGTLTGTTILPGSGSIGSGGIITAPSFIPSSATAPTNGLFLPAANTPAISVSNSDVIDFSLASGAPFINIRGDLVGSFPVLQLTGSSGQKLNIELDGGNVDRIISAGPDSLLVGGQTGLTLLTSNATGDIVFNSGLNTEKMRLKASGHLSYKGSAPSITAGGGCGGGSPTIDANATDNSGQVTVGTATTTCVITFANAFATYNHCQVTSGSTLAAFAYTYTLSAITVSATVLGGDKIDYRCDGV